MLPKDPKKVRGGTPVSSQHPHKNININISYNITLGKQNKSGMLGGLVETETRKKKPTAVAPQRKERLAPKDDGKPFRKDKIEPSFPMMSSYLQSKLAKPVKKKKPLNLLSRTEQTRIVKFLTQQPQTSQMQNQPYHRRITSKDRQEARNRVKSSEHSRRNNSDGSKGGGSKQLKELRKKPPVDKRKKSKSMDITRAKCRNSVPNSRSRMESSAIYELCRRRKIDTQQRFYTREQSPEEDHQDSNETLVQKLIRTEISSVAGQPTQSSPEPRGTLMKKTPAEKQVRIPTELSFTKKKQPTLPTPVRKVKLKTCLTDRLREDAARKIQRMWRAYKKRKLMCFYGDIFTRNCPVKIEQISKTPSFNGSSSRENEIDEMAPVKQFPILTIEEYREPARDCSEEELSEEFQFNIRKYEDIVERTISAQKVRQYTFPEDSSCSRNSELRSPSQISSATHDEIEFFKAHQLEQWNRINTLISQHLSNSSQHEQLLKELIQHSEMNKRWIEEQSCFTAAKSALNKPGSHLPHRYRQLVEETNIVQKLKNKSVSQKRCLQSKLEECVGSLSSSSSKKHPHVYLDSEAKTPSGSGKKIETSERGQADKVEQRNTFSMEEFVNETISEEAPSDNGTPKPDADSSWRRLSLEKVQRSQQEDIFTTPVGKADLREQNLRSEEMNRYMQRQLFSRQSIFESVVELQLTRVCEELLAIRSTQAKLPRRMRIIKSSQPQKKAPKGIRTDYAQIKRYVSNLITYILEEANQLDVMNIVRNINYPLGPSSKEVLEYLSLREICDQSSTSSAVATESTEYVINISFFHKFEIAKADRTLSDKLQSITYHWHQAIFEAFNECLDEFRPYGVYGQPYIWEVDGRIHTVRVHREDLRGILLLAADRLYVQATVMAGIIFDKEDSPVKKALILDETKREVNEERMSRMLANMLLDEQANFINYKDEVVELQIELSYALTELAIREAVLELSALQRRML